MEYLMDPDQVLHSPPPGTQTGTPPGTPPAQRSPSFSPSLMDDDTPPHDQLVFGPEPLSVRIPVYNANYNPACLTHKDVWLAMNLPTNAIDQIVVALDARGALGKGGASLEAAHYAYANGNIPGEI
jgi:hypothetical protein